MTEKLTSGVWSDVTEHCPGCRAYTTPKGIRVVEIDYWANPKHGRKWAAEQRLLYPSNKDWRREMERDWSSPAGEPYFPTFSGIGRDRFVHVQKTFVDRWPVFRSFDFGRRKPAAVWVQFSIAQDRMVGYREFMPHDISTHQFRDACLYLSGQLGYKSLGDDAKRSVDEYALRPSGSHCPPPWFPAGTKFMDIGGKEATMRQANAINPEDAVAAQIFAAGGINLIIVSPRILGRNHLLDRLLPVRNDGWPGIFIDPQMEESIEGFEGAWCYPEPTKAVPVPTKPRKDGHFENLLDCWGYAAAAIVPDAPESAPQEQDIVRYKRDGRTPVYGRIDREEPNWSENR